MLGIDPASLDDMEPADVVLAYHARLLYDQRLTRSIFEANRLSGYMPLVPHMRKGSTMTPSKLMPFHWEKGTKKRSDAKSLKMTKAQRKIKEKWDRQAKENVKHGQ